MYQLKRMVNILSEPNTDAVLDCFIYAPELYFDFKYWNFNKSLKSSV